MKMNYDDYLNLFEIANNLKRTPRTGWVRCGVKNPESVADHIFRTTLISMFLSDHLGFDTCKVLKMALLHDLAEAVTGDITPHDHRPDELKLRLESDALIELVDKIPNNEQYIKLWDEFTKQITKEAQLVKNIDKFEMALQAFEYKKDNSELELSEFITDVDKFITIPEIKIFYENISTRMENL